MILVIIFAFEAKNITLRSSSITSSKKILFLIFLLVAGTATETGIDWYVYSQVYTLIAPVFDIIFNQVLFLKPTQISVEPGYLFITSIAKQIGPFYEILTFILSFIATKYLFKAIDTLKINHTVFFILYWGLVYLSLNMSGIRQAVALSITTYSLACLVNDKKRLPYLGFLIAILFHYSAIIFLIFSFILKKRIQTFVIIVLSIFSIGLNLFKVSILTSIINGISIGIGNPILLKFLLYSSLSEGKSNFSVKIILYFAILVIALIFRNKYGKNNVSLNLGINLAFVFLLLQGMFWDTGDFIIRLLHYFVIGYVIILSSLYTTIDSKIKKFAILIFSIIFSVWSSNPIFFETSAGLPYNPYQSWISNGIFGFSSTGLDRLEEWKSELEID